MKTLARLLGLLLLAIAPLRAQTQQITSTTPPNTIAGAVNLPLTVNGVGFVNGAQINWNGAPQSTTFVSSHQLTATISSALTAQPNSVEITVTQASVVSARYVFQVLTPFVSVDSYTPTTFTAGTGATINVYGHGFSPQATIFFDWFKVSTTFVSPNQLTGSVTGGSIIGSGPHHVYVYNATVPSGQPSLLVPSTLSFGNQQQGTTSAVSTVTITNISAASVTLSTPYFTITGVNAADFTNTGAGTCANGGTIAPSATCTVKVTFTPSLLSKETAILSISSTNGIGSPQYDTLTGTGVPASAAAAFRFSVTAIAFSNVAVGTTSQAKTTTVTNTGSTNLTISAISITGVNAADFIRVGSCTSSTVLSGGQSCTIVISFVPSTTNTESATVSITDSAVGSPHLLFLTGNGATTPTSSISMVWTASPSSNLIGYNVYRGTTNLGPYTLLTPTPVAVTNYTDSKAVSGTLYYYVVTAVGTSPPYSQPESVFSNQVSAVAP